MGACGGMVAVVLERCVRDGGLELRTRMRACERTYARVRVEVYIHCVSDEANVILCSETRYFFKLVISQTWRIFAFPKVLNDQVVYFMNT